MSLIGKDIKVRKVVGRQQLSLDDGEVDFNLVEPGRIAGGLWSRSEMPQRAVRGGPAGV
jgi:hypothetical protein